MRLFVLPVILVAASTASAHHPNREAHPVYPRIEVIPPLGNNLPPSYRRKYNRPTYHGGKIAYHIAPSSQEAMAWHRAVHSGAYERKHVRLERYYFYPKPWEALKVGPRVPGEGTGEGLEGDTGMLEGPSPTPAAAPQAVSEPQPIVVQPVEGEASVPPVDDGAAGDAVQLIEPALPWEMPGSGESNPFAAGGVPGGSQASAASTSRRGTTLQTAGHRDEAAPADPASAELEALRAQIRRLKQERDLLKQATGLFKDESSE